MIHKRLWAGAKTLLGGAAAEFLKPRRQGPAAMPGMPDMSRMPSPGIAQNGVQTFHNIPMMGPLPPINGRTRVVETPGWKGAAQRFVPGGATGLHVESPAQMNGIAGGPPKGYHLNKSSYFLLNGTYVAKGSKYVKNRHRNPLNPRALKGAVARIDAGKIWQSKLSEISTGKFTAAGNRRSCPN